ncbi:MAG: cyclic nucleotide-binding domain-containing protein [Bacteroidota bacterium]
MKENFVNALTRMNPNFTPTEIEMGMQSLEHKHFKAKDIISEEGQVAEYLLFADSSIIRCYYHDQEGEECTLWMKPERTFLAEYKSFTSGEPSRFSLQVYEDTEVMMIRRKELLQLFQQANNWSLFGVHLTEHLHATLIDVFVNLLANDATSNYRYIEYAFPRFLQVAPLKDIASMLQISQVSLSRIRSGNQLKA